MKDITVITVTISDKNTLMSAYMPYVKNGGLFIKGLKLNMGDKVGLIINLPVDNFTATTTCDVIWITKKSTTNEGGVGIQFDSSTESAQIKLKIDNMTAGIDRTKIPTFTA